jgi:hypothetical protein
MLRSELLGSMGTAPHQCVDFRTALAGPIRFPIRTARCDSASHAIDKISNVTERRELQFRMRLSSLRRQTRPVRFTRPRNVEEADVRLFYSGHLALTEQPCVSRSAGSERSSIPSATQADTKATPITRLSSGSKAWPSRNGVIGMAPPSKSGAPVR